MILVFQMVTMHMVGMFNISNLVHANIELVRSKYLHLSLFNNPNLFEDNIWYKSCALGRLG